MTSVLPCCRTAAPASPSSSNEISMPASAWTDWALAEEFQVARPQTFAALQQLVMAMAQCRNTRGKKTLFGRDKPVKAMERFDQRLRETLVALSTDGEVTL